MKLFFALCVAFACSIIGIWQVQAMTSTNYAIPWDNVSTGGSETGTSTSYTLYDTIGQTTASTASSTSYTLAAGYRADNRPLRLSFEAAFNSAGTGIAYTAFSSSSKTVTVSSSADLLIGSYLGVLENRGFGAMGAIGKITNIVGNVVTVDAWDGEAGVLSTTPSGGNDYVYQLRRDVPTINFGSIEVGAENITLAGVSVYSSASSGHAVYIQANQVLQRTSPTVQVMTSVADGTVSNNAEEYGVEAIGTHAAFPGVDVAVTTTQNILLSSSVPTGSSADRLLMLFKLGLSPTTPDGSYSQQVYLTLTSNF